MPHGNLSLLQHQTNTLHPYETGAVRNIVMFGPGTNEAIICKLSATQPTPETVAHIPS